MTGRWDHAAPAQRIVFGPGSVGELASLVRDVGGRRALLVTSATDLQSDAGREVVRILSRSLTATFDGAEPGVPASAVQRGLLAVREADPDVVVSLGGAGAHDLGKALRFLAEQERGTPGASFTDRPVIPQVAVPTTYAGAALSAWFGITDDSTRRRTGAGGPTVAPLVAVYDPELSVGSVAGVAAATGMLCLAHGVEGSCAPGGSPESRALALECVRRAAAALPAVVDDPADGEARSAMLEAAVLGGRAVQAAPPGATHGLADLVAARSGVDEAVAHAVLLAPVLRWYEPELGLVAERLGAALGDVDDPAGAVDRMRERVGLPSGLAECGVTYLDLEAVARMSQGSAAVRNGPRGLTEEQALELLEEAS